MFLRVGGAFVFVATLSFSLFAAENMKMKDIKKIQKTSAQKVVILNKQKADEILHKIELKKVELEKKSLKIPATAKVSEIHMPQPIKAPGKITINMTKPEIKEKPLSLVEYLETVKSKKVTNQTKAEIIRLVKKENKSKIDVRAINEITSNKELKELTQTIKDLYVE
jgi:hypothetical protein